MRRSITSVVSFWDSFVFSAAPFLRSLRISPPSAFHSCRIRQLRGNHIPLDLAVCAHRRSLVQRVRLGLLRYKIPCDLQDPVHYSHARAIGFIDILRNLLGQDGEILADQQLVQHIHIQVVTDQPLCCFLGQTKPVNIIVRLVECSSRTAGSPW